MMLTTQKTQCVRIITHGAGGGIRQPHSNYGIARVKAWPKRGRLKRGYACAVATLRCGRTKSNADAGMSVRVCVRVSVGVYMPWVTLCGAATWALPL